jgi:alpha-beta hydrolase superfamily lysophospholipase
MVVEAVQATTADGIALRGELIRGGDVWICLVHDEGEDIDAWRPLRAGLSRRGWTVLALDHRGHGGSDGEWPSERAELDVDLTVTIARRSGARHVSVVAAGSSGLLALRAVERALAEESFALPDSLVLVSPGPLGSADPMTLRGQGLPKLFIRGGRDPLGADSEALREASIGWTLGVTFGTSARGGALVGEQAVNLLDKVVSFLNEQSTLRGLGQTRAERRPRAGAS